MLARARVADEARREQQASGSASMLIVCGRCGQVLGMLCAGHVFIKHHHREIVADRIVAIKCEECGQVWRAIDSQPG